MKHDIVYQENTEPLHAVGRRKHSRCSAALSKLRKMLQMSVEDVKNLKFEKNKKNKDGWVVPGSAIPECLDFACMGAPFFEPRQ